MKTRIYASLFILSLCLHGRMQVLETPNDPFFQYFDYTFRIKGTVTDSTDNSPVVAYVSLNQGVFGIIASTRTNSQGQYTIEETASLRNKPIDASNFYLLISAEGYKTKAINSDDENHVQLTHEWQTIDVQLEPENTKRQ